MKFNFFQKASAAHSDKAVSIDELCDVMRSESMKVAFAKLISAMDNKELFGKIKRGLPCWCPMGFSESGDRAASKMTPTPLFMIDLDHVEKPVEAFNQILQNYVGYMAETGKPDSMMFAHITPSGKGLRFIFHYVEEYKTIEQHVTKMAEALVMREWGDVDAACKDVSRLSFLVPYEYVLYRGAQEKWDALDGMVSPICHEADDNEKPAKVVVDESLKGFQYKGHSVAQLAKEYTAYKGVPEVGERHNFYNTLIKNFRNICNNDKNILLAVLPDFGTPVEERASQIKSICKQNNSTSIPKDFYFWLKDSGVFTKQNIDVEDEKAITIPALPPVFKEFVACAPNDFKVPTCFALLPIIGTLTSYLRGDYLDGTERSTTFFTLIYAPAAHGKSFVKRLISPLLELNRQRDLISNAREAIYLNTIRRKADSKEAPQDPHVTLRELPSINSQPELLTKMRDAQGYHIFTYEEELDTFKKGTKAASNDKSDMLRVAWDNGEYGQAFKSANTFKGIVRIYWNLLLTGTDMAVARYFKNVEDGLVTRFSFCDLGDQSFAKTPVWKKLNAVQKGVIRRFIERCDANTYTEPLEFDTAELLNVPDDKFDEEVPWRFTFKPFQYPDMSWYNRRIAKWLEEQRELSAKTLDFARDQFRRRKGDIIFRICLMGQALYTRMGVKEKTELFEFAKWMANIDLDKTIEMFGQQVNEEQPTKGRQSRTVLLYDELPEKFTQSDVLPLLRKYGLKQPVRKIIHVWSRDGLIRMIENTEIGKIYLKIPKK